MRHLANPWKGKQLAYRRRRHPLYLNPGHRRRGVDGCGMRADSRYACEGHLAEEPAFGNRSPLDALQRRQILAPGTRPARCFAALQGRCEFVTSIAQRRSCGSSRDRFSLSTSMRMNIARSGWPFCSSQSAKTSRRETSWGSAHTTARSACRSLATFDSLRGRRSLLCLHRGRAEDDIAVFPVGGKKTIRPGEDAAPPVSSRPHLCAHSRSTPLPGADATRLASPTGDTFYRGRGLMDCLRDAVFTTRPLKDDVS